MVSEARILMKMALKSHILFVLLLFVFANSIVCSSLDLQSTEREYDGWISWNLKNHRKKVDLYSSMSVDETIQSGRNVDRKLRKAEMYRVNITVSQDGDGDFSTINEAIATIPTYNSRRVVVMIKPGVYREKIHIPRTMWFVTFVGDEANPPTITGNDTASVTGKDGIRLNTFQSATVAVDANYFIAINIKFQVIIITINRQSNVLYISLNHLTTFLKRGFNRIRRFITSDRGENKQWHFVYQGQKLHFIIAVF